MDLVEAGVGAGGEQAEVVGDADDLEREVAECGADLGHGRAGLHGPTHVFGRDEVLAGDFRQALDGEGAVAGVGVDAGADGGASEAELAEGVGGAADAVAGAADGDRVGAELLAEPDGDGVLHVGAAGFEDAIELAGF